MHPRDTYKVMLEPESLAGDGSAEPPRTLRSELLGKGPRTLRNHEVFEVLETCTVATAGNVMISAWHGQVRAQEVVVNSACAHGLMQAFPDGIGLIVILPPHLRLPSEDERARMHEFYRVHRFKAVAFVVLGDGFWASAVRGVLTALKLVGNRDYPTHVLRSGHAAVAWLAAQPHLRVSDTRGLHRAITRLATAMASPMSYRPPAQLGGPEER